MKIKKYHFEHRDYKWMRTVIVVRIVTVPRVTIVTAMWLSWLPQPTCWILLYFVSLYDRIWFVFIQIICKLRWDVARKSTRNKTFALALVKICMPFYDNIFSEMRKLKWKWLSQIDISFRMNWVINFNSVNC